MGNGLRKGRKMKLQRHPLSAAFPDMQFSEYESLLASVQSVGLLNPIVLFEGMIIDGWHRYCACEDSDTQIRTIELSTDVDPQTFVIAQNKERRHLTQSQLATAAIKVYEWRKRGTDNLPKTAQSADLASPNKINDLQNIKTSAEIAKNAGVSLKTVEEAKQVLTQATPEIKEAVSKGEISVSTAVKKMAKAKVETPPSEDYAPSFEEIAEAEAEQIAKEKLISQLLSTDNPQAELVDIAKKDKAMIVVLESRVNGLMNTVSAYAKIIKLRDNLIAKLKKQLGEK